MKTTVIFRNFFDEVEIPHVIDLIQDLGSDTSIYTPNKPRVLRGRRLIVSGSEEEIKQALDFWIKTYKVEIFTDL